MHRNAEPNLEDALSDDLVQAMMKADRVDPLWLRALLESVARSQGLDRPTVTGRSCSGFQGGPPGPWLPWRGRCPFGQTDRLGCEKTRK
jgi:hypothetical protein